MTVAAIDRLVHHAVILEINTESYRRKTRVERYLLRTGRNPLLAKTSEVLSSSSSLKKWACGGSVPPGLMVSFETSVASQAG